MARTDQEILTAIREAIYQIATGEAESYSLEGRSYTALDLEKLEKMERFFQTRVNRAARSANARLVQFQEPT